MTTVSKNDVLRALEKVRGPDMEGDLVSLGLVSEVVIAGANIMFALTVPAGRAKELEPMREAAQKAVLRLDGVEKVMVALTAERPAGTGGGNGAASPRGQAPGPAPQTGQKPAGVPGVKHIIAVASGKGGVGKSTTAANLALGLRDLDLACGVLDADIYGPSLPRLLGLTGRPEPVEPGSRVLKPVRGYGLECMSIGFLVEEDTPVIWRGPMVMSALQQMMREVLWGDLDILVVDMPPGTGDAQLTMAQQTPLAGGVIVSTPQDLALIDARKGLNMFRKVEVPVLGIVENMSHFTCGECGARHEIFGNGGARNEAEKLGVPFLGEVPLDIDVRRRSDAGTPVTATAPDSPNARIYREIAAKVWQGIEHASGARQAPRIVVE